MLKYCTGFNLDIVVFSVSEVLQATAKDCDFCKYKK